MSTTTKKRGKAKAKPASALYFAYGSNLSKDGMSYRCPDSTPVGPAKLHDWQLTFRGVADVEPAQGEHVTGALWNCPPADVASLDAYEGVRGGFYRREFLQVELPDGSTARALVYIMCPTLLDNQSMPSPRYLGSIVAGFHDFGLDHAMLEAALDRTYKRVIVKKGINEFVPHGPKRMGPAGTQRGARPAPAKTRRSSPRTEGRVITLHATTTASGKALPDLSGMSPATRAIYDMEQREKRRKAARSRDAEIGQAVAEGAL